MNLSRDINIKPSFLRELHALPAQMGDQIWEKINFLAQNPIPDGHLKKKLNKWDDVYRLRIGDFRLFYSFGGNWIRLLSIRPRKNAYETNINYEEPLDLGTDADIAADEEVATGFEQPWLHIQDNEPKLLPFQITNKWLEQLGVSIEFHDKLVSCITEDDLLMLDIPGKFIERILDNMFPRPVEEIMQQPDLVVYDTNDLIRYKEGDLLGFLLRLDSDQERLVDWALQGPALIKGGPGTGKSTIALYRVRSLLDYYKKQGKTNVKILFTTYTSALTRFSQQLLQQLLGDRMHSVKVEMADEIAIQIVGLQGKETCNIADKKQMKSLMEQSVQSSEHFEVLNRFRIDYLLDEIEWIIDGRNLINLDGYLSAIRNGRGIALTRKSREIIWDCYKSFCKALDGRGLNNISRIRCKALELVKSGVYKEKYNAVIIDEAQDLTPVSLALLSELSHDSKGIYLTADASQSIYYKGFSWNEIHERLQFRGRAINLRRNYRTTREISEAATHFLKLTGSGDPDSLILRSVQTGPQPLLFGYETAKDQSQLIVKFIKQMSRHLRLKSSSTAILVPSTSIGKELAEEITKAGIPCKFVRGNQLDLQSDEVKVLTLSSSKGLEFPIVCIAGLDKTFPRNIEKMDKEEMEEEMKVARRTLYVGITRAMRGLMVMYDKKSPSIFIKELNSKNWYTENSLDE